MSTTAAPLASTAIDFLDIEWTHPDAIDLVNLARELHDAESRAITLAVASKLEWGTGDELTSEAHRRMVLACDRTGSISPGFRAALIAEHRLDDLCPIHLEDLDSDGVCRTCDEDDV